MTRIKHLILYPLCTGIFPLLFLYAHNINDMLFGEIVLPLAAAAGASIVLTLGLGLILKNYLKSALIVSLGVFSFFAYGHIRTLLRGWQLPYPVVMTALVLLVPAAGITILVLKTGRNLVPLTRILNFSGGLLVVMQIVVIIIGLLPLQGRGDGKPDLAEIVPAAAATGLKTADGLPAGYPDIYYIILDGYGRLDILRDGYDYDNSAFVRFLEQEGFLVFGDSRSHYCQTLLSLSATLNMDYIDNFGQLDPDSDSRSELVEKFRHNALFDFLKPFDYSITAFASGYAYTELKNADLYLKPEGALSEFQNILLTTTALSLPMQKGDSPFDRHRRRIAYILDQLPRLEDSGEPRFVFAHLVAPHPPFVFGPNGEAVQSPFEFNFFDGSGYMHQGGTVAGYIQGYVNQLRYLNRLVTVTIRQLLSRDPDNPPVIILQSDHGPGARMHFLSLEQTDLRERFSILNALYLPGYQGTVSSIHGSPVNTFRLILNTYFRINLRLHEHKSYYSTWYKPYKFIDVTNRLEHEADQDPVAAGQED